jgi:hypothetical protein
MGYISSEDVFKFFVDELKKRPYNFLFQTARGSGLHLVSKLFRKVHVIRRSQEALHGFSQENTRTTLVSNRQDLEE